MKQVVVMSGKGGTGKTVITGSFATLAGNAVLADCDVDAADLHLLLHPVVRSTHEFVSGQTARIDAGACTGCGTCLQVCRFGAVREAAGPLEPEAGSHIDPLACEGCGLCARVCPENAIVMEPDRCGEWYVSATAYGPMIHAALDIGAENSGKLVAKVKEAAKDMASRSGAAHLIVDGPPGIGCPVFAALAGADVAVIAAEPTMSGIHDMERILQVARHFGIPAAVVINKYDLNQDNTWAIQGYCERENLPVAGRIPFSHTVTESVVRGVPLVEHDPGGAGKLLEEIWIKVTEDGADQ